MSIVIFSSDTLDLETREYLDTRAAIIKGLLKNTTSNIIDVGKLLLEIKEKLPHGQFGGWLQTNSESLMGLSERTAGRMMAAAVKFATVADLERFTPTALYLLSSDSVPDDVREVMQERAEAGEAITPAVVKAAIEEVKTQTSQDAAALHALFAGQTVGMSEICARSPLETSRRIKALNLLQTPGPGRAVTEVVGRPAHYKFAPLAAPAEPVTASPTLPAVEPVFQPANIPDPRVRFDNALITIASPDGTDALDKGCFDRAIEVGRFLVSNGLWDGQSPVMINNPYALHSRIYGLDHAPASSVIAGTDYVVTLPAPDQAPDQTRSDAQKEAITEPSIPFQRIKGLDIPPERRAVLEGWLALGEDDICGTIIQQRAQGDDWQHMLAIESVRAFPRKAVIKALETVIKKHATDATDAIAWAAGELPIRQREMLLSVWAGAGVVKNAATRIALINRNLLKNGARGKDWWAVIEMTDKGRAVAEYLVHLAADSLRKSATATPEADPPADPAPRPQPLTVAVAKEMIIDALRQSNRALGFNELRKYAGIEGEAPGVYGQAVQEMVAAGSLASFFSHGTGTRYHFPEMVAKLLDDDLPPLTHREFVTVTGLHTRQLRDLLSRPYVLESLDDVQIDGTRQQIRETLDVLRDLQARLGTINGTLIDAQLDLSEARAKAATEAAGESDQPAEQDAQPDALAQS